MKSNIDQEYNGGLSQIETFRSELKSVSKNLDDDLKSFYKTNTN